MKNLTLEHEFESKQQKYVFLLKYMRDALGVKEVTWSNMTTLGLSKIKDYIADKVAGNSAITYLAVIKAFLALYVDEGLIPCKNPAKELKLKRLPSEQVILSIDEIRLIENYQPRSQEEQWIKAQFLCEYYCMARSSDINKMDDTNIHGDYITYISQKTKTKTTVPLHDNFMEYFHQRGQTLSRMSYNRIIKRICKNVGINKKVRLFYHGKSVEGYKWEFVGSHTARRSAASELAKRNVPLATIGKLMNHGNNLATTQRYIFVEDIELNDEAAAFFSRK